jgi:hypothetical protein
MPGSDDRARSGVPSRAANYGTPCRALSSISSRLSISRTLAVLLLLSLRRLLILLLLLGLLLSLRLCLP